ncbi:hypothetical protein LguiB_013711 [Lonicera macranthoides]
MAMVVSKWISLFLAVVLLVLLGVVASVGKDQLTHSSAGEMEHLQGTNNSSMATRLEEGEAMNEHAVDDPEEIASLVDM